MRSIKRNKTVPVFSLVLFVNLLLFAVKLYIGLSSNSISIYSDGINNLFDGFSCLVAIICVYFINKADRLFSKSLSRKAEQLLTLAISIMVFAVGILFLYNSAERLMYPAPVWFSVNYFWMLFATAAVKLVMFFVLKKQSDKHSSSVIRVMSFDSLTDFFITSVTVLTLFISQKGGFSVDAFGGIAISIFVVVSSLKNIKHSGAQLLNLPDRGQRLKIERLINEGGSGESCELDFSFAVQNRVYLKTDCEFSKEAIEALKEKVYNETGMKLYIIK